MTTIESPIFISPNAIKRPANLAGFFVVHEEWRLVIEATEIVHHEVTVRVTVVTAATTGERSAEVPPIGVTTRHGEGRGRDPTGTVEAALSVSESRLRRTVITTSLQDAIELSVSNRLCD